MLPITHSSLVHYYRSQYRNSETLTMHPARSMFDPQNTNDIGHG